MKIMNDERIKFYKKNFPEGTRVQLDRMGDYPNPIPCGTKGVVLGVDDIGTLHVIFDNGRCLGICPEVDSFHKISEQEENLEPTMSM